MHRYLVDPLAVLYLYDCPPGYAIIALRCAGCVWLAHATAGEMS